VSVLIILNCMDPALDAVTDEFPEGLRLLAILIARVYRSRSLPVGEALEVRLEDPEEWEGAQADDPEL